jgi:hypothetical protein
MLAACWGCGQFWWLANYRQRVVQSGTGPSVAQSCDPGWSSRRMFGALEISPCASQLAPGGRHLAWHCPSRRRARLTPSLDRGPVVNGVE